MKRLLTLTLLSVLGFQNSNAQTKYDDKIVFSKSPISETPDDSKLTDKFEIGETIYVRFFLSKPLMEYKVCDGKPDKPVFSISLYDEKGKYITGRGTEPRFFNDQNKNIKNYAFKIVYSEGQLVEYDVLLKADMANALPVGNHTIKVEVKAGNGCESKKPISTGSFTLTKTNNSNKVKGKTFNDIEVGMKDPKIEAKAIEATNAWLKQNGEGDVLQKQECKILRKDWTIVHHPSSGAILSRALTIAYLIKDKNGECHVRVFCLGQAYAGSGYQETLSHRQMFAQITPYEHSLILNSKLECE